ncbi:MAG TPA: tetratricopeptide repeat protein [Rhizomicrobium sp.]|jgi:TolB-like protein/Flp pilus assembly protein TadD|nr:tetratricopeptide repeat protein [Rhizomicrobium sp.]
MVAGVLRELQRRNVIRAAILYVGGVWLLAQVIVTLGPVVGAPDWLARGFLVAAAIGFPFWITFAWFYELTPEGIRRESEVDSNQSILKATGRRLDFLIIGVLAVAVVLLLTDLLLRHEEPATSATSLIADKSVAVLPLVNESGDANALYFSDGLSEAFIDALSQFSGLKVIARVSSFQFRNSKDPVSVIGGKLGVAHLLEGSVQRAGDAVRISAELINVKDGAASWSAHYDRPYKDLFKLQDDITNAVAAALKAKLLGGSNAPPPQSDRPPSGNLEAYNAYLEGIFYAHRSAQKDGDQAVAALNVAVRLDPDYAAAWAALASAELNLALASGSSTDLTKALAGAHTNAEKALALAPDLAAAHNALGLVFRDQSNWTGADAQFRRASQLAPAYAAAKANLADMAAILGRPADAAVIAQQALKLNPLGITIYVDLASILMPLGRLNEAETAIRHAIALEPDGTGAYATLSSIDVLRGNAGAALADAQREPAGVWHDVAAAQALQIGRDRAAADAALKNLIAKYSDDAPLQIAETYGQRKDADNVFKWLEHARVVKDPGLEELLYDPFLLPYRHDPRFAKLCQELNLPVPKD